MDKYENARRKAAELESQNIKPNTQTFAQSATEDKYARARQKAAQLDAQRQSNPQAARASRAAGKNSFGLASLAEYSSGDDYTWYQQRLKQLEKEEALQRAKNKQAGKSADEILTDIMGTGRIKTEATNTQNGAGAGGGGARPAVRAKGGFNALRESRQGEQPEQPKKTTYNSAEDIESVGAAELAPWNSNRSWTPLPKHDQGWEPTYQEQGDLTAEEHRGPHRYTYEAEPKKTTYNSTEDIESVGAAQLAPYNIHRDWTQLDMYKKMLADIEGESSNIWQRAIDEGRMIDEEESPDDVRRLDELEAERKKYAAAVEKYTPAAPEKQPLNPQEYSWTDDDVKEMAQQYQVALENATSQDDVAQIHEGMLDSMDVLEAKIAEQNEIIDAEEAAGRYESPELEAARARIQELMDQRDVMQAVNKNYGGYEEHAKNREYYAEKEATYSAIRNTAQDWDMYADPYYGLGGMDNAAPGTLTEKYGDVYGAVNGESEYILDRNQRRDANGSRRMSQELYAASMMTPEEKEMYNYLYNSPEHGKKEAQEYLDYKRLEHLDKDYRAWMDANYQSIVDSGDVVANALLNVATIPGNLIGGPVAAVDAYVQNAKNWLGSDWTPINMYSSAQQLAHESSYIRGAQAEALNEKYGTIDTKLFGEIGLGNALQGIDSALESLIGGRTIASLANNAKAAEIGGRVFTGIMGASAGANEWQELYERDPSITNGKALLYGTLMGVNEAMFEYLSLENLIDLSKLDTSMINDWKKKAGVWLGKTLAQAGIEGSEEIATGLADTVVDLILMGDDNKINKAREKYFLEGYLPKEATKLAWKDWAQGIAQEGLLGTFSGGLGAGTTSVMNVTGEAIQNAQETRNKGESIISNQNTEAVANIADTLGENSKAKKYAKTVRAELEKGNVKAKDVGRMYRAVLDELGEQSAGPVREALNDDIRRRLQELGITSDGMLQKLSDGIVDVFTGKKLDQDTQTALAGSRKGMQVLDEVMGTALEDRSAWAQDALRKNEAAQQKVDVLDEARNAMRKTIRGEVASKASKTGNMDMRRAAEQTAGLMKSGNAKAAITDEETGKKLRGDVTGVHLDEDGVPVVVLRMEDGSTREENYRDVEYGTDTPAALVTAAAQYGKDADRILKAFNPAAQQQMSDYIKGMQTATRMARAGVSLETIQQTVTSITAQQAAVAEQIGSELGSQALAAQEVTPEKKQAQKEKAAKGNLTYSKVAQEKIDMGMLNGRQQKDLQAVRALAEAMQDEGVSFKVYASEEQNGEYRITDAELAKEIGVKEGETVPNGAYKDGTVYVDLNAGMSRAMKDGSMMRTMGHEITHHIFQHGSREEVQALKSFVADRLTRDGIEMLGEKMSFDAYVETIQATQGLDYDAAVEEAVANASEMMLNNSQAISELAQQNRGLFQRIKDRVMTWIQAIRDAFQGVEAQSREAKAMLQYADEMQKVWDAALKGALAREQWMNVANNQETATEAMETIRTEGQNAETTVQNTTNANETVQQETQQKPQKAEQEVPQGHVEKDQVKRLLNRSDEDIKSKDVKPFVLEHQEFQDDFAMVAALLKTELDYGTVGERIPVQNYDYNAWQQGYSPVIGIKRKQHPIIEELLDDYGWTYDRIIDMLTAMEDMNEEVLMKRHVSTKTLEALLEGILMDGFKSLTGEEMPGIDNYVQRKAKIPGMYVGDESADVEQAEGKTKFSMREPVEETRDLIAVHNLSDSDLRGALELGGMPMPSIAVTKADMGHDMYGDVSLVFSKDTIDPETDSRNAIYSQDAWTPTFPEVEWQVNQGPAEKAYVRLNELRKTLAPMYGGEISDFLYEFGQESSSKSLEELIQKAERSYGMKAAYLEDTGRHVEPITERQETEKGFNPNREETYRAILDYMGEAIDTYESMPISDLFEKYGEEIRRIWEHTTGHKVLMAGSTARLIKAAKTYRDYKGPTYINVIDQEATQKAMDAKIDNADYRAWLKKLLEGVIGERGINNGSDPFTSRGDRRSFWQTHDRYTLENVVRQMARGAKKGVGLDDTTVNADTLTVMGSKKYQSIEEVRQAKGNLRMENEQEREKTYELATKQIRRIQEALMRENAELETYQEINAALIAAARGEQTNSAIRAALRKEGVKNASNATLNELRMLLGMLANRPTGYFEAKPERAVTMDEVAYAVVPADLEKGLMNELRNAVADVRTYTRGDNGSRLDALNSRPDVKFSTRDNVEFLEDDYYAKLIDDIRNRKSGGYVKVGKLLKDSPLVKVGMLEGNLYFDVKKITDQLDSHDDHIDENILKEIPEVLRNPMVIAEPIFPNTISVYGSRKIGKGSPLMVGIVLSLNGDGNVVNKIRTVHARRDYNHLISEDSLLYVSPDIEKTRELRDALSIRVQSGKRLGVIRSVHLTDDIVKALKKKRSTKAKFQARDNREVTDRELLADAMESIAENDAERQALEAYKAGIQDIANMESELQDTRIKLREAMFGKPKASQQEIEKLQKKRDDLTKKIGKQDERLLIIQRAKPLQNILAREREQYNRQASAKVQQKVQQYREAREDTHNRQVLRNEIARGVRKLDKAVRTPTDSLHVPDGLKNAAAALVGMFTQDDNKIFDREKLLEIQTAYANMAQGGMSEDSGAAGLYDEDIDGMLTQMAETLRDRTVQQLSTSELNDIRNIIDHFQFVIENADTVFMDGRKLHVSQLAEKTAEEMHEKGPHVYSRANTNPLYKLMMNGELTPVYFGRMMGGTMGDMFNDLLRGETKFGVEAGKAKSRIKEIQQKHSYDKWAGKKNDTLTLETPNGPLTLTREQALGLYATRKREITNKEQQASHLFTGGVQTEEKVKKGILGKYTDEGKGITLTEEEIRKINEWLTDEQKAYADDVVGYLSKDMAELGNETSMNLHGWKKFGEGYYYPYRTSSDYKKTKVGDDTEASLIKAMGFTKKTTFRADTPIVISNFTDTCAGHIGKMLLYNAFAEAQDNFMRVYDYKLSKSETTKGAIRTAMGKDATKYINRFMTDLFGGVTRDNNLDAYDWLTSRFKRGAVMVNASVAIQQPTAVFRAMAMVNPKYFIGGGKQVGALKGAWAEAKKYAGTAVIKDMGKFDTGLGKSATEYIGNQKDYRNPGQKAMDAVDTAGGFLPEQADKITWSWIWQAVKRETADRNPDLHGEELLQEAGRRFDDVIRATQVYDSVLAKSQIMRSKDGWAKMITSFMAEPTLSYNMLLDAVRNKKLSGGQRAATIAAVMFATLATILTSSLVAAARKKDEDKTYMEKYISTVVGKAVGSSKVGFLDSEFSPLTMVPILQDVLNIFTGYDVQRTDMNVISDLYKAAEKLGNEKASAQDKWYAMVGAIGNLTGIPAKNVWREFKAAYDTVLGEKPELRDEAYLYALREGLGYDDSKAAFAARAVQAYADGDTDDVKYDLDHMKNFLKMDEKQVQTKMKSAVKAAYLEKEISWKQAEDMLVKYCGTKDKDAAYFEVEKWGYNDTKAEEAPDYTKYQDLYAAIDGNESIAEAKKELTQHGYDAKDVASTAKSYIGKQYKDGEYTKAQAEAKYKKYCGMDADDCYWQLRELDYAKAHKGSTEGYGKYQDYLDSVLTGGKAMQGYMNELLEHGVEAKTIASQITSEYKKKYLEYIKAGKLTEAANLQAKLLAAYELLGYDRNKKLKDIRAWEKDLDK